MHLHLPHNKRARVREQSARRVIADTSGGFTLIELLVVIAIVGVLAAIGVQNYNTYRRRGFDARASQDLRSVAIAEEAYFVDNNSYRSCEDRISCGTLLSVSGSLSEGTVISMTATVSGFTGNSSHPKGSKTYAWDSSAGGLQP